jgi:hypothetical protein
MMDPGDPSGSFDIGSPDDDSPVDEVAALAASPEVAGPE